MKLSKETALKMAKQLQRYACQEMQKGTEEGDILSGWLCDEALTTLEFIENEAEKREAQEDYFLFTDKLQDLYLD